MILSFVYFDIGKAMSQNCDKRNDEKQMKMTELETQWEHVKPSHLLAEDKNIH